MVSLAFWHSFGVVLFRGKKSPRFSHIRLCWGGGRQLMVDQRTRFSTIHHDS